MEEAFTFDDVCLIPQMNNIESRTEPDLTVSLTKDIQIGMPLVPANMDTVIGPELAEVIIENGGMPIFHRFCPVEEQIAWVQRLGNKTFISCGLNLGDKLFSILDNGPAGVCIDVAHGHSPRMVETIQEIKKRYPKIQVIAGNICTPFAYHDLYHAGADAIKVGVGPGAACTTRMVTGFGVPQFTAIRECAEVAKKLKVPIIADGGIRDSRDMVLALAAGASSVMIGKLFALTKESAATKQRDTSEGLKFGEPISDKLYAKYRGQASKDFQEDYYGGLKEKTVAEGTDFWAPVAGTAQEFIDKMLGGLRSAMTYGAARSIKEFQSKATFRRVTPTYLKESNPRRD